MAIGPDVTERVGATGLLPAGAPVVVLLSGGRDSVCLLDCAVRLGARVTALHVNYGLRGAEADADEAFCAALCARLGAELRVVRPRRESSGSGGNVQAWARDARYSAAAALASEVAAREGGAGVAIATGHTATDQAETILYRLAASPGRRALLGMRPRDGALVRPLLALTREQTAAHCTARGLDWREDATNGSDLYARNRIRAGLVPALRAVHPAAERNVVRTAELLRDEAEVLEMVVDTALAGRDEIAVETLRALPRALARLVLRRLAEDAVGGLCSRVPARLEDVLQLGAGALDLGDGARAVIEDGILRIVPTPPLPAHA